MGRGLGVTLGVAVTVGLLAGRVGVAVGISVCRGCRRRSRGCARQADRDVCDLANGNIEITCSSIKGRFRHRVGVAARRQNGIVSAIGDRSTIKPLVDQNPCISQRCAPLKTVTTKCAVPRGAGVHSVNLK